MSSSTGFQGILRAAARIAVPAGAVGSLGLMFYAGRRNSSLLLALLFAVWVTPPFLAALRVDAISERWAALTRTTLHGLILVLTPASLAVYGAVAFGRLQAKTGFVFLMVPLASWLLLAIGVSVAAALSGRAEQSPSDRRRSS